MQTRALSMLTIAAATALPHSAIRADADQPVLTRGESRDWALWVKVDLQSTPQRRIIPDGKTPGFRISTAFSFDNAVFVYPLLESTAAHDAYVDNATSSLSVDGVVYDREPTLLADYQAGERMGRWDVPALTGNLLRFQLELPMTCYNVSFDEARAMRIPWPKAPWPPLAASALLPQHFVESDDEAVRNLARRWTGGNPGGVPPARLAKILASKTIEHFRTTITDLGYIHGRHGELAGLDVQGAAYAARKQTGTPTDLAAFLCAVYRAAGLPARVVIGYDLAASLGVQLGIRDLHPECNHNSRIGGESFPVLRTWVEFYLYDEAAERAEWIPVDIHRQYRQSSKPPPLDRRWDFFGHNPCLQHVAPISFHFHPPTTVTNSGPPALWGWLPQPDVPVVDQRLDFGAREPTTRRGND